MARRIAPDEAALWRHAMRDVRARRKMPADPEATIEIVAPHVDLDTAAPTLPSPAAPTQPSSARGGGPESGSGLDRRTARRLKRGEMAIEARLDLHGLTQDEAHGALLRFIARHYDDGTRAVLVITGKGGRDGEGVLRRAVPRWLGEARCRPMILDIAEAGPQHGGAGALYVLLRRRRTQIQ